MKLTAQAVSRLRHEGTLPFFDVKDDITPGLYLRILKSGAKRWVYRYKLGGKTRVATFGDVTEMTLAAARAKAVVWRSLIREGRDPAGEDRRQRAEERRLPTVEAFAAEFIERHSRPNKRTWREDERLLDRNVLPAIGPLRIDTVTRRDIVVMLDAIRDRGANVLANRLLAVTRRMFGFAIERGVIATSPIVGIRASRETPRERVLSDDEVVRLWAATAAGSPNMELSTRLALRLLLLTGARASEVCGASWSEVDMAAAVWTVPGSRTKNGVENRIPLSDAALAVIAEAATQRTGNWLLKAARGGGHLTPSGVLHAIWRILDGVTVHDLRRTVATGLQRLGVRLETTEAILNHVSGSRAGVVGIYQRHDFAREKRTALDAWAAHIGRIVEGDDAGATVVKLLMKG
jgi:integrase